MSLSGGLTSIGGVELTFVEVSAAGQTTVVESGIGPVPPTGFQIVGIGGQVRYWDLSTSATYTPPVTVCIHYDEGEVMGPESALVLMHEEGGNWIDITSSLDVSGDVVCGLASSLSPFAVMEPLDGDNDGVDIPFDNCPTLANPGQDNFDLDSLGDTCDLDDDNDGYSDIAEAGTPLCGNGINDDGAIFGGSDDGVADDGCPGGPPQAGAYSEAQFNIGLGDQDPCGLNGWPSDFASGGIPDSTNRVTVTDLTSFLAPVRRLDTSPGHPDFDDRWDLVPGRGLFATWINVNDITARYAAVDGGGTPGCFLNYTHYVPGTERRFTDRAHLPDFEVAPSEIAGLCRHGRPEAIDELMMRNYIARVTFRPRRGIG